MDEIISLEEATYHNKKRLVAILSTQQQATLYGMSKEEYEDLLQWDRDNQDEVLMEYYLEENNMSNKQLVIKNKHGIGTHTFESGYGEVEVSVYKVKGLENCYLRIDGRKQSFCKKDPCEMWELVGEYLGIEVVEGEAK